jgi:hypothetical protein
MSASLKYAATGVGVVAAIVLGLWPFLDAAGRSGVLIAAGVAVPVQVFAFAALIRFRGGLNGFLAAWLGGTVLRMVVIAVVAFLVIRSDTEGAVPMLLALAGFFFGLLLLEPVYFRIERSETVEA